MYTESTDEIKRKLQVGKLNSFENYVQFADDKRNERKSK